MELKVKVIGNTYYECLAFLTDVVAPKKMESNIPSPETNDPQTEDDNQQTQFTINDLMESDR